MRERGGQPKKKEGEKKGALFLFRAKIQSLQRQVAQAASFFFVAWGPQGGPPRTGQRRPKTAQDGAKTARDGFKTYQVTGGLRRVTRKKIKSLNLESGVWASRCHCTVCCVYTAGAFCSRTTIKTLSHKSMNVDCPGDTYGNSSSNSEASLNNSGAFSAIRARR